MRPQTQLDRPADAGFSLIEVLMALALLAVSLAAFYPAYSGGARGLARTEERIAAGVFAQSLMEQVLASRTLAVGTANGTAGQYRWTLTIAPNELPSQATLGPGSAAPAQTGAKQAPSAQAAAPAWLPHDVVLNVSWGAPTRSLRLETVHLGKADTGAR